MGRRRILGGYEGCFDGRKQRYREEVQKIVQKNNFGLDTK